VTVKVEVPAFCATEYAEEANASDSDVPDGEPLKRVLPPPQAASSSANIAGAAAQNERAARVMIMKNP